MFNQAQRYSCCLQQRFLSEKQNIYRELQILSGPLQSTFDPVRVVFVLHVYSLKLSVGEREVKRIPCRKWTQRFLSSRVIYDRKRCVHVVHSYVIYDLYSCLYTTGMLEGIPRDNKTKNTNYRQFFTTSVSIIHMWCRLQVLNNRVPRTSH